LSAPQVRPWRLAARADVGLAVSALLLMMLIPLAEMALRPLLGRGIENASVLVQHLGLMLAMFGAVAAERQGQLTTLGSSLDKVLGPGLQAAVRGCAQGSAALVAGMLAAASARFVASETQAGQHLAYGLPVWWVQAALPLGFAMLGLKLGSRCAPAGWRRLAGAGLLPLSGAALALLLDGRSLPLLPCCAVLLLMLLCGAPVFAVLGGLALALFGSDGLPWASIALSHYQITVNPSLPALPLFTLAGLVFARTGAANRLSRLFLAIFGGEVRGTVLATSVLCSIFTAFTGGSGVTILALGGLLLPLLRRTGYPEQRGIGLVTSASALGVLLAPSVPLIMVAVIARVPIKDMFLAGLLPAAVMVACLLVVGGYLRPGQTAVEPSPAAPAHPGSVVAAAWAAKWEILAPAVAIGPLVGGYATPMESAALTAAYAIATQAIAHRELGPRALFLSLLECAQVIGGVMLILGMALALTNYLVDAGIPDAAIDWTRGAVPNRYLFLLGLCLFLCTAAALMEIFAAIVVLVPLLLPVARSYGIDPVHFGIIFLAAMELGFLCPPAGMNIYFAAAMFGKPMPYVARSVLPAVAAIFMGTLVIALLPALATGLPRWVAGP
jgi:tripartite ATP-independent transporter DctM subunit